MATISFYADDSSRGQIFAVAGYAGATEMWEEFFVPRWEQILTEAPHPISEFKASDCQNREGEFKCWTEVETVALTTRLVSLIVEACATQPCVGFGTAIIYPGDITERSKAGRKGRRQLEEHAFNYTVGPTFQDALNVAGAYCHQRSLDDLGIVNRRHDVQPILDRKDGFAHRTLLDFKHVCKDLGPELASVFNEPVPGDSRELMPLQAADLLAFEIQKEVRNRCERRKPRRALERLVTEGRHRARCFYFGPLDLFKEYIAAYRRFPDPDAQWLFETGRPIRWPGLWGSSS